MNISNAYTSRRSGPIIAPAMVVRTDQFANERRTKFAKSPAYIQAKVREAAHVLAPHVSALHFDINCSSYVKGQPPNVQVFTPKFLMGLKQELGRAGHAPLFDIHILGQNILIFAGLYLKAADHISFEMEVVDQDAQSFRRVLAMLAKNSVSVGVIGSSSSLIQDYFPYLDNVDILGITAGKTAGRSEGPIDISFAAQKARALIENVGFAGSIIFQMGVTEDSIPQIVDSGANILVCGTNIFKESKETFRDAAGIKAAIQGLVEIR
ncbi:MAG: hypothetical protein HQ564_04480 [Candidatus Saganbacteria bacterium]|nr:hypothetical protein [Candidatus Saganbacteria bacterium]